MIYIFRSFSMVVNIALRMDATLGFARFAAPFIQIENSQRGHVSLELYSPKTDLLLPESKAFVLNLVGLLKGCILAIGSNSKAESAEVLGRMVSLKLTSNSLRSISSAFALFVSA